MPGSARQEQLNNREVSGFLKGYLAEDGLIVTLRNGIPEDLIASVVGPEHTVGVVVEWGKKVSVPTPVNDRIVRIITEIQDSTRKTGRENLKDFIA